jgi:hypothetical protein
LNLTDAFTGSAYLLADLLKRPGTTAVQAETHLQNQSFTPVKVFEQIQKAVNRLNIAENLIRGHGSAVGNYVLKLTILALLDWIMQRKCP